eukprot:Em0006g1316a
MGLKWLQTILILLACWTLLASSPECYRTTDGKAGSISYRNPLLQLRINNIDIHLSTDTSTAWLAHTYPTFCEALGTTSTSNSSLIFTRCYCNTSCADSNSSSISLHFTSDEDTSTWQLSSVNYMYGNTPLFNCSVLSPAVMAKGWAGSGFYCGNVNCSHGEVQLQQIWVQAFGSVNNGSSFLDCGRSSSTNVVINLVVGAAVGGSVAVAVVVIVIRFTYRRCRYGKYNLLNE